jgi:hypothetical protein
MTQFRLTTWLWKKLHNFFLKIIYSSLIVDLVFLTIEKNIWTNQLARLLRNSRIHIEFHSKLFTRMTKNGLKNEMVKLSDGFFMKP